MAKFINELRRKTKDVVLARRSKSLLKRWREMLLPAAPPSGGVPLNQSSTSSVGRATTGSSTTTTTVPQQSRQAQFTQNGSLSNSGRSIVLPNNRAPFMSHQSQPPGNLLGQPPPSLLSLHNSNSSSSLSSVNKLSPNKLAALSHHQQQTYNKHKENQQDQNYVEGIKKLPPYPYNNNNSLRVPSTSSSRPSIVTPIMEIINLTDDRSNSPSLFQQLSHKTHSGSPKIVRMHNDNSMERSNSIAAATSANNSKGVPSSMIKMVPNVESTTSIGLPIGTMLNNSRSMTCDNDYDSSNNVSGTSSRKHKKHKREKKNTTNTPSKANYNHLDDRSAPNLLTTLDENSLITTNNNNANSLILPDNDSLSNTSASLFNFHNKQDTLTSNLSFAGRFAKAQSSTSEDLLSPNIIPTVPYGISQAIASRSVSPSIFISHHSNHSIASGGGGGVDPDVTIVNHIGGVTSPIPPLPLTVTQEPVKVQKKRGRKKGSKGIDSLLASQNEGTIATLMNADSFFDLKQKITSISGTKKVKTTKELLADIQNKRSTSGNLSTVTSPSVTQAPSPESLSGKSTIYKPIKFFFNFIFCYIEMSHHSHSTDAGVRSSRTSPEPSTSTAVTKSQSMSQPEDTTVEKKEKQEISSRFITEDIEVTIKRLMAQLPPIDYTTLDKTEEEEQLPKCTCTLREVRSTEEEDDKDGNKNVDNPVNIEVNIIKDSDEEMADAELREQLKTRVRKKKREKIVKSIFDLDEDDNEDGVGQMNDSDDDDLESVPDDEGTSQALNTKESISAVLAAGETISQQNPPVVPAESTTLEDGQILPELPKYEAIIDSNCAAMQYYETDRNDVTNFHIETLHDCFVPNVNGNWNQRNVPQKAEIQLKQDDVDDTLNIDTANRVVPRYNFLVCDKIPKHFEDFHFDYQSYVAFCRERKKRRLSKLKLRRCSMDSIGDMDTSTSYSNNNHLATNHLSESDSNDIEMKAFQSESITTISDEEMDSNDNSISKLSDSNNGKLTSFNEITANNRTEELNTETTNTEFSEWYQSVQAVSTNEDLIILPYVVID